MEPRPEIGLAQQLQILIHCVFPTASPALPSMVGTGGPSQNSLSQPGFRVILLKVSTASADPDGDSWPHCEGLCSGSSIGCVSLLWQAGPQSAVLGRT
jgi:hypothetical protein